ncbi:MAG: hypothetical protein C0454_11265, partial [Parvibaculum sp.]|nr:hypothetical protein [Parvibaculum sp.]
MCYLTPGLQGARFSPFRWLKLANEFKWLARGLWPPRRFPRKSTGERRTCHLIIPSLAWPAVMRRPSSNWRKRR